MWRIWNQHILTYFLNYLQTDRGFLGGLEILIGSNNEGVCRTAQATPGLLIMTQEQHAYANDPQKLTGVSAVTHFAQIVFTPKLAGLLQLLYSPGQRVQPGPSRVSHSPVSAENKTILYFDGGGIWRCFSSLIFWRKGNVQRGLEG